MTNLTPRQLERIIDALSLAEEYFDQRADADGDSEGFYPNEEMYLRQVCADALLAFPELVK
jgi:hypothetical protein